MCVTTRPGGESGRRSGLPLASFRVHRQIGRRNCASRPFTDSVRKPPGLYGWCKPFLGGVTAAERRQNTEAPPAERRRGPTPIFYVASWHNTVDGSTPLPWANDWQGHPPFKTFTLKHTPMPGEHRRATRRVAEHSTRAILTSRCSMKASGMGNGTSVDSPTSLRR